MELIPEKIKLERSKTLSEDIQIIKMPTLPFYRMKEL
jgi:hypothetical protein